MFVLKIFNYCKDGHFLFMSPAFKIYILYIPKDCTINMNDIANMIISIRHQASSGHENTCFKPM